MSSNPDPHPEETNMAAPASDTTPAFGADLAFTRQPGRPGVGGTWVVGLLAGHRFQALVFPDHADDPTYELGASRMSKLWVQRLADRAVVFNFDRGLDIPAQGPAARAVVAFLAAHLTDRVFA
jgi:hypothetical protein